MKELSSTTKIDAADFTRTWRRIRVDPETMLSDVMRPGFWKHKAGALIEGDILEITAADWSLDMLARVVRVEPGLCFLRVVLVIAAPDENAEPANDTEGEITADPVPEGYKVDHTPRTRWRVRTVNPVVEVSRNHSTKAEAVASAAEHFAKAEGIAA